MALNTKIRGNQINDAFFGAGLVRNADVNIMDINVDDSSIEISADALQVKAGGITNDMLAGSIADGKLVEDYIKTSEVDDSTIEFAGGSLNVKDDGITKEKINADVAGTGILQNVDGSLELNVDDSSIELGSGEQLRVKAGGITNDMLAGSIADGKLAEDYIKTSEVDGTTIEFSGGSLNVVANGIGASELDETDTYDFTGGTVQVATPSAGNDAVNKTYVDGLVNGLQWKDPVRALSTVSDGNITLSGVSGQSLDGVSLSADDRVLLTEQTDASENGIWVVKSGAWERPADFPTGGDAVNATCLVSEGTSYADTQWTCTSNSSADTIDTNDLAFAQISGAGGVGAGDGLVLDGSELDVNVDDSSIEINADVVRVKALGITNAMLAGSIADGKLAQDYIQTSEVDDTSIEFSGGTLNVKAGGVTNDMLAGSIADGKLASDYIQTSEVDGTTIEFAGGSLNIVDGGVGTTQLANDSVDKDKIASDVAGNGIVQNVDGSLELNVDDSSIEIASGEVLQVKALGITNAMLAGSIADTKLAEDYIKTSEVDDSTIEFNGGTLNVKALGITNSEIAEDTIAESKLDIHNAPSTGQVLGYTANGLEWVSGTSGNVNESDIQVENESANCNGATTDFTLDNTPITNSVQVFLNGLLQEEGSGKDYTLSGTTVAFADAPLTNDILIIHYVIDN